MMEGFHMGMKRRRLVFVHQCFINGEKLEVA